MLKSNRRITVLSKFILFLILIVFVVSACGSVGESVSGISTWTPSPSATATCVPNISLSTPEGWGESRIIVIIYDDRFIGDDLYLEFENGGRTQDVSLLIKTVIPSLIEPKDQISVFQLGYSSFDDAIVSRLFSYISPPELYNTPPAPNVISTNPPVTLTPGLAYVATQNAMTQQAKEIIATNAANESDYLCAVEYWNKVVQQTATAWDTVATAEVSGIVEKMDNEFESYRSEEKKRDRSEPYRTNELYYGGLYYGLSFASTVFGEKCSAEVDCVLIIIDDLRVYGKNNPDSLQINLTGVDVIAIMPNCRYIDQPDCEKTTQYWDSEFNGFGVSKTEYWNGIRAEINIKNFLRR
jgi:hypothetical protein